MDKDGTNSGYDLELTKMVKEAITIPVIASYQWQSPILQLIYGY